jgi:hypothetical protein
MPTALPAATDFTGAAITEAQFKTAMTSLRTHLADLLGVTGTPIVALQTLGALGNSWVSKTGAYAVVAADRGKLIGCSGTFTLSLTAAATLGADFSFAVLNYGTGTITIAPNSSEQIDGATTIVLAPGESCVVICTAGTAFRTLCRTVTPAAPPIAQVVSTAIAAASGSTSIPNDNTAPLSSEGTQIASLSITPASLSNKVRLTGSINLDFTTADDGFSNYHAGAILAVFRDTTLVGSMRVKDSRGAAGVGYSTTMSFHFEDSPSSMSATTYSVRVGKFANTTTWYVNRSAESATALGSSMANTRFTAEELTA